MKTNTITCFLVSYLASLCCFLLLWSQPSIAQTLDLPEIDVSQGESAISIDGVIELVPKAVDIEGEINHSLPLRRDPFELIQAAQQPRQPRHLLSLDLLPFDRSPFENFSFQRFSEEHFLANSSPKQWLVELPHQFTHQLSKRLPERLPDTLPSQLPKRVALGVTSGIDQTKGYLQQQPGQWYSHVKAQLATGLEKLSQATGKAAQQLRDAAAAPIQTGEINPSGLSETENRGLEP